MRLHKYMAYCQVASRRSCERIIAEGRVKVNGKTVTDMGVEVDPEKDEITLDGTILQMVKRMVYILLNKPKGYICSVSDQYGRPTVLDLVKQEKNRVYPVGRLDYNTEGLLLLTNDGNLTLELTHPRHEIEKEYSVIVKGKPSKGKINRLRRGIDIGGHITSPALVIERGYNGGHSSFTVIIKEGKNRQIRRMFNAVGHPVISLKRERIGNLTLGDLKTGEWRYLKEDEIKSLKGL